MWGTLRVSLLLGVAEAPNFPANSKATGFWFPRKERALATAIFDAGAKFANVIGRDAALFGLVDDNEEFARSLADRFAHKPEC